MRRIQSTRKLTLKKETLRTLAPEELASVGGATGYNCQYMTFQNDPAGSPSGMGACPSLPPSLSFVVIGW